MSHEGLCKTFDLRRWSEFGDKAPWKSAEALPYFHNGFELVITGALVDFRSDGANFRASMAWSQSTSGRSAVSDSCPPFTAQPLIELSAHSKHETSARPWESPAEHRLAADGSSRRQVGSVVAAPLVLKSISFLLSSLCWQNLAKKIRICLTLS
jgi:hypothetical protein